jgi:chromosome partitioning protein
MENLYAKMTAADTSNFLGVNLQTIHKQIKSKNLEAFKSQNRVFFGFDVSKNIFGLQFKKKIISFQIVKGGTGKTSIAHSFAIRANLYGARVLCIDLDQQANLTQAFSVDSSERPVMIDVLKGGAAFKEAIVPISPGLDLFPSRIENAVLDNVLMVDRQPLDRVYTDLIKLVIDDYDVIVIDCPPALGHSVAAATLSSDLVISPVTPEQFGLSGVKITYDEIQSLNKKNNKNVQMKILLNKFDSRTALSNEVLKTLLNDVKFKDLICNSVVRVSQDFPNAIFSGTNIFSNLRNTSSKEDIDLLVREILELDEILKEKKMRA